MNTLQVDRALYLFFNYYYYYYYYYHIYYAVLLPRVTQQNCLLRAEEGAVSAIVSLKCCGIGHTLRYRCNSMTIVTTYQRNDRALVTIQIPAYHAPPRRTATINQSNPGTPGSYFKQYLAEASCFPAKSRPPLPGIQLTGA